MVPPPRRGPSVVMIVVIVLAVMVVMCAGVVMFMGAALFPTFSQARNAARTASCSSNLKQLSVALMMYATDYDNVLPPAERWTDGARVYSSDPGVLECPAAPGTPGYAYNSLLDRKPLSRIWTPGEQPMLFDSTAARPNAADALKTYVARHPKSSGPVGVVAFADGSVRTVGVAPGPDVGLKRGVSPK
jgi:hypothetical protein